MKIALVLLCSLLGYIGISESHATTIEGEVPTEDDKTKLFFGNRARALSNGLPFEDGGQLVQRAFTSSPDTSALCFDWNNIGRDANGVCRAITQDANGNVYVAGSFTSIGGIAANRIAMWDGQQWHALGSGLNSTCNTLAVDSRGNVYAGGRFTRAGGQLVNMVAMWNGDQWAGLGTGLKGVPDDNDIDGLIPICNVLTIDNADNVYVGGEFVGAGNVRTNNIARWNGSTWSRFSAGVYDINDAFTSHCSAIAIDESTNDIYVGGSFDRAGQNSQTISNGLAKWDGNAWRPVNAPISSCSALAFGQGPGGKRLYVAGKKTVNLRVSSEAVMGITWADNRWESIASFNSTNQFLRIPKMEFSPQADFLHVVVNYYENNIPKLSYVNYFNANTRRFDYGASITATDGGIYDFEIVDDNIYTAGGFSRMTDPNGYDINVQNAASYSDIHLSAGPEETLIEITSSPGTITLTGNFPPGGTWSGPGVDGNRFDPLQVEVGTHTVFYSYTNTSQNPAEQCVKSAARTIIVTEEGLIPNDVERQVLTNLYNDMGGPGWLRQQGWLEAENLADWQGVVVENGDVSRLDLSNNNLMNTLPLYLEQLTGLKELVLYANRDISSPLPSTLGNLSNLELLDLSNCSLGDTVPGNMLSKLTWLRQLRLDANQFTGEIPMDLGKLTSLQVLTLGFNDLEGEIPRSFSQLQSLQVFSLSQNFRLGGDITPWLTAFPMIRVFDVAFNNFVGYLPEALKDMTTLSNLILNSNDLSGTIAGDLFENIPITDLNLNDNHFNGPIPRSVLKSGLASLNLGNNEFEGDIADGSYDWDQLTDLTHLVLEDNKLTGKILEKGWSFGENLEWLSLAYNNFYGKIGLTPAQLANLRFVFLQGNEFTDISAVCPAPYDCSDLVLMNVSDNLLELKKLVTGLGLSVNSSGNIVPTSDGVNGLLLSPQKTSLYFNRKKQSLFITGEWNLDHHIPQYQWFKDYVTLTNPTDEIEVPGGEDYNSYSSTIRYNGVNNFVVRSLPAVEVDSANMYWAIADGNWTDRIWSRVKNGVPTHDHPKKATDHVVIADHNVTLSSEVDCAELKLVAETDSTSLTVRDGKITVYGDIILTKQRPELIGSLKVESGGKVVPLGASAQR